MKLTPAQLDNLRRFYTDEEITRMARQCDASDAIERAELYNPDDSDLRPNVGPQLHVADLKTTTTEHPLERPTTYTPTRQCSLSFQALVQTDPDTVATAYVSLSARVNHSAAGILEHAEAADRWNITAYGQPAELAAVSAALLTQLGNEPDLDRLVTLPVSETTYVIRPADADATREARAQVATYSAFAAYAQDAARVVDYERRHPLPVPEPDPVDAGLLNDEIEV